MILLHFWHYFYVPSQGAWYTGNVWGNVFVVAVLAPLGWLWARTKFWPLKPIERHMRNLHTKVDALHARHDQHHEDLETIKQSLSDLHQKHDELRQKLS